MASIVSLIRPARIGKTAVPPAGCGRCRDSWFPTEEETMRNLVISLGLALLATAPAFAEPVNYTSYSVLNNQTVTINDSSLGIMNLQGGSGEIVLNGVDNATGHLDVFCVDIQDDLTASGSFSTQTTFLPTSAPWQAIDALLANETTHLSSNTDASSALQVAIWAEEYGSQISIAAPSAVLTLADTFIANVSNNIWTAAPGSSLTVLSEPRNQSQIYFNPAPVPEPASMALLGAGVLGLAAIQRARRKAA